MKTIEQQKADLLDKLMENAFRAKNENGQMIQFDKRECVKLAFETYQNWRQLIPSLKESGNPYIDEVFDMRICNVISEILNKEVKKIRLSDCPHISKLDKRKNIGFGSIQAYEVAMRKYELNDKLI